MLFLSAQQCDSAPSLPSWLGWSVSALLLASPLGVAQTAERGNSVGVAAASLGSGDGAVLSLVRELTEWRNRALDAESRLAEAGFQATSAAKQQVALGTVLRSVPEERVLLVGVGRSDGALPGALLVIGGSVYARVVDVRSSVSAALVDQSFSGNISTLEGKPARLAVR
ncbi:MAG: hypothetical protein EBR81_00315 [Proteobacteria bacterium]|nr:hypothetical protein [Pseudomonadota bacterium]